MERMLNLAWLGVEKNGYEPTETAFAGGKVHVDLNILFF